MQPTIRSGDRNEAVKTWQRFLGVAADGIFGPVTRAATIAWQRSHALAPDGIVGPLTWATLVRDEPAQIEQIWGVDVSAIQGAIDWPAVRASGIEFAYVKASEGAGYTDPRFLRNAQGALEAGLAGVGAYTFARPDSKPGDAEREAEYFASLCKGLGLTMPGMLDLESKGPLSGAGVLQWASQWCRAYQAATGEINGVYTGKYFFAALGAADPSFADLPLWVAQYPIDPKRSPEAARAYMPPPGAMPKAPAPWGRADIWQFSGNHGKRVPGVSVDCDRNVWLGTRRDFEAFTSSRLW